MTVKRAKKTRKNIGGGRALLGTSSKLIRGISKKMFVDAYIANKCNGRQAMKALGAPHSTAAARASDMLRDPEVKVLLKERMQVAADELKLSADEVLESLTRAIRFDPRELFDSTGKLRKVTDLPTEIALELEGWHASPKNGIKIDFPKKHAARDQAMRFFGMFMKDKAGFDPNQDDDVPTPVAVTIDFKDARRKK